MDSSPQIELDLGEERPVRRLTLEEFLRELCSIFGVDCIEVTESQIDEEIEGTDVNPT